MRFLYALAAVLLLSGSVAARADSLLYYTGTVSGIQDIATLDPNTGLSSIQSVPFTGTATGTLDVSGYPQYFVNVFIPLFSGAVAGAEREFPLGYQNGCYGYDDCFEANTTTYDSYETITFYGNSVTYAVSNFNGSFPEEIPLHTYYTGTFTEVGDPSAVTPEPSSVMLLGTGLLGAFGMARRRRFVHPSRPTVSPGLL